MNNIDWVLCNCNGKYTEHYCIQHTTIHAYTDNNSNSVVVGFVLLPCQIVNTMQPFLMESWHKHGINNTYILNYISYCFYSIHKQTTEYKASIEREMFGKQFINKENIVHEMFIFLKYYSPQYYKSTILATFSYVKDTIQNSTYMFIYDIFSIQQS